MIATAHVPYHVCGAQQDGSTSACRATPTSAAAGAAAVAAARGGAPATVQPRRRRARLHRARSEGHRHLLRRRQQRIVPDAARIAAPATRARSTRIRASSPASRRARWSSAGSGPIPIIFSPVDPTRALHLVAARVADDERRRQRGTRSAATSPATIRRRWASPAARSPTT